MNMNECRGLGSRRRGGDGRLWVIVPARSRALSVASLPQARSVVHLGIRICCRPPADAFGSASSRADRMICPIDLKWPTLSSSSTVGAGPNWRTSFVIVPGVALPSASTSAVAWSTTRSSPANCGDPGQEVSAAQAGATPSALTTPGLTSSVQSDPLLDEVHRRAAQLELVASAGIASEIESASIADPVCQARRSQCR